MHQALLKKIKEVRGEEGLTKLAQDACKDKPEQLPDALKLLDILIAGGSLFEAAGLPKEFAALLYQTALNQYNNGLYVPAGKVFALLHYIDPERFDYAYSRACATHQQKKYDAALSCYSVATHIDPKDPRPYYHMADCWEKLGKPFSAYQALLMAYSLAIDKRNATHQAPFADNIYREMQRLEKKMKLTKEFKEKTDKKTDELFAKFKDVQEGKMDISELASLLLQHRQELDKQIEANMHVNG